VRVRGKTKGPADVFTSPGGVSMWKPVAQHHTGVGCRLGPGLLLSQTFWSLT
jgi:hypothetical protein